MKKVTSCLSCGQLVRLANTYKVEAEISHITTLTGERKTEKVIGRVCGECAYNAGYKVRKELLPVEEKGGDN